MTDGSAIDAFHEIAIACARAGFREPPNLEVEVGAFLEACHRARETDSPERFHGRAIRMALRYSMGAAGRITEVVATAVGGREVWVTKGMVEDGVRFAAPQGWMTIRAFPAERERILASIERFGMNV